ALVAAVLIGSRGALAVALVAGSVWSWMSGFASGGAPHLPFLALWLVAAGLALLWNSPGARHLVAIAALYWWAETAILLAERRMVPDPIPVLAAGAALTLGAAMLIELRGSESIRAMGATLVTYGWFGLALVLGLTPLELSASSESALPYWVM